MNRGRLNGVQLFCVALLSMWSTLILLLPGGLLRLGGRYAWWTPLLAAPAAAAFNWGVGRLAATRGDLVDVARSLGPVAGRALLLPAWAAVGLYTVAILREGSEGAAATFVAGSIPIPVFVLLGLIPAGLLAWLGPVVIGRTSSVLAPLLVGAFLIGLLLIEPVLHAIWALPLLPRDGDFAAWPPLLLAWEWLVEPAAVGALFMHSLQPAVRRAAGGILAAASLTAALCLSLGLWVLVADFGPGRATQFSMPFLAAAGETGESVYVQHFDTLTVTFEMLGNMLKTGIFFWLWTCLSRGLSGLRGPLPLLVVLAGAGVLAVVLFANVLALDRALYAWVAVYGLPVLAAGLLVPYAAASCRRGRPG